MYEIRNFPGILESQAGKAVFHIGKPLGEVEALG